MIDSAEKILPGTGRGTTRRVVEGYAVSYAVDAGLCPSTMLRMVPLPLWGRTGA
ncbi:hypothetical protein SPYCA_1225 [Sphingopyxis sp. FD7]|jgi:hypothetical protein|nr:hypothetical protein SPYCA_1225 [Sphingopyxis sp. FD7]